MRAKLAGFGVVAGVLSLACSPDTNEGGRVAADGLPAGLGEELVFSTSSRAPFFTGDTELAQEPVAVVTYEVTTWFPELPHQKILQYRMGGSNPHSVYFEYPLASRFDGGSKMAHTVSIRRVALYEDGSMDSWKEEIVQPTRFRRYDDGTEIADDQPPRSAMLVREYPSGEVLTRATRATQQAPSTVTSPHLLAAPNNPIAFVSRLETLCDSPEVDCTAIVSSDTELEIQLEFANPTNEFIIHQYKVIGQLGPSLLDLRIPEYLNIVMSSNDHHPLAQLDIDIVMIDAEGM